eukprot:NODE_1730_length_1424_cov_36.953455_g1560_i0.p1 GENE.NODE_1730_length_1424_cov_36.953455_g1560_i0~~NODE_1730_length_1424_cov_36.953455_g1560_i0.p1  ORF type:complete len:325 (-),score=-23.70 NODE_1730_length_1424_cov_36.953455_g1560_i0:448-1335(-)
MGLGGYNPYGNCQTDMSFSSVASALLQLASGLVELDKEMVLLKKDNGFLSQQIGNVSTKNLFHECFLCSVCLSPFKDPHIAECGHTFCMHCIQKVLQTTESCPICRSLSLDTSVPNYSLGEVMSYFSPSPFVNDNQVRDEKVEIAKEKTLSDDDQFVLCSSCQFYRQRCFFDIVSLQPGASLCKTCAQGVPLTATDRHFMRKCMSCDVNLSYLHFFLDPLICTLCYERQQSIAASPQVPVSSNEEKTKCYCYHCNKEKYISEFSGYQLSKDQSMCSSCFTEECRGKEKKSQRKKK